MYTSYKEANLDDYAWAIPTLNYGKSAAFVQPLGKHILDEVPSISSIQMARMAIFQSTQYHQLQNSLLTANLPVH